MRLILPGVTDLFIHTSDTARRQVRSDGPFIRNTTNSIYAGVVPSGHFHSTGAFMSR
jgi:hypothetical protein